MNIKANQPSLEVIKGNLHFNKKITLLKGKNKLQLIQQSQGKNADTINSLPEQYGPPYSKPDIPVKK